MALRAAKCDESLCGDAIGYWTAWAVEVGSAVVPSRPSGSMIRSTQESQSMCAATPAGEAAARNGALLQMRALRFHAGDNKDG